MSISSARPRSWLSACMSPCGDFCSSLKSSPQGVDKNCRSCSGVGIASGMTFVSHSCHRSGSNNALSRMACSCGSPSALNLFGAEKKLSRSGMRRYGTVRNESKSSESRCERRLLNEGSFRMCRMSSSSTISVPRIFDALAPLGLPWNLRPKSHPSTPPARVLPLLRRSFCFSSCVDLASWSSSSTRPAHRSLRPKPRTWYACRGASSRHVRRASLGRHCRISGKAS